MSQHGYKQVYHRNLPHIVPPGATLFVTYRLAGSVPQAVVREYKARKDWLEEELERQTTLTTADEAQQARNEQLKTFKRQWFAKFEDLLHQAATGPVWLKEEPIAKIVADSLHFLDGKSYRLDAYCVMANHVHAVFAPFLTARELQEVFDLESRRVEFVSRQPTLSRIMQSLKGYTARVANQALGRKGQFWQHESYDHFARDAAELGRIIEYVLNNPVKAGLVAAWQEWPWSYRRPVPNAEA